MLVLSVWKADPCFRRFVADLSQPSPGFDFRSVRVKSVLSKVWLWQVFLRVLGFSPVSIIPGERGKMGNLTKPEIFRKWGEHWLGRSEGLVLQSHHCENLISLSVLVFLSLCIFYFYSLFFRLWILSVSSYCTSFVFSFFLCIYQSRLPLWTAASV